MIFDMVIFLSKSLNFSICYLKKIIKKSDFDFMNQLSWIGKAPTLQEADIPYDWTGDKYPLNFARDFNLNPKDTISLLKQKNASLENSSRIGPFLFFCNNLSPVAITNYIISNQRDMQSIFYFFFCSPVLDYMNIHDAARMLISRIALPNDMRIIQIILESFSNAYYSSNQYISESMSEISKLVLAAIIFSMSIRSKNNNLLSQDQFLALIDSVKSSKSFKINFYNTLKINPIPIFFTFATFEKEPNDQKNGQLKQAVGIFKKKLNLYYKIINEELQSFRDQELTDFHGGIELSGTMIQFSPSNSKEQAFFTIKRFDNQPFGYKIKKSQKKQRKKNIYMFTGVSDEDTKQWSDLLQFSIFYSDLISFAKNLSNASKS